MESLESKASSIFISYAHKDGLEFTRRLAFALGMYFDVFWDRNLKTGKYAPRLFKEIEARDFFLFVMTPASASSDWCQDELKHAQKHNEDGIVLAQVYSESGDDGLKEKYTCGFFHADFDVGFRRITGSTMEQPYSSWEYLGSLSDEKLLAELSAGHLPGLIARSIAEWILVEKFWPMVENYAKRISSEQGLPLMWGQPRTPNGVVHQCTNLLSQFGQLNDGIGHWLTRDVEAKYGLLFQEMSVLLDHEHQVLGTLAAKVTELVYGFFQLRAVSKLDGVAVQSIQSYFHFDVAEKLRELILVHARRSRYLY